MNPYLKCELKRALSTIVNKEMHHEIKFDIEMGGLNCAQFIEYSITDLGYWAQLGGLQLRRTVTGRFTSATNRSKDY